MPPRRWLECFIYLSISGIKTISEVFGSRSKNVHLGIVRKLIRKYDDGGFSITPKTIAFYDEKHRKPYIRVFWFVAGAVLTAFLDFVVALLNKITECV